MGSSHIDFELLAGEVYFAREVIKDGVVIWSSGLDIAPGTMYGEVSHSTSEVVA